MAGHAREEPGLRLEVAEHAVAEHHVAVAGLSALMRPWTWRIAAEVDEPLRVAHWERREEQLVEQRVDRRIGADPERQRQDGDDRYERRFEERSNGELDVAHVRFDSASARMVECDV